MNKLFRVIMTFDMSWGSRSRLIHLSHRTRKPRVYLANLRSYGYFSRGRHIPAARLLEARIVEVA